MDKENILESIRENEEELRLIDAAIEQIRDTLKKYKTRRSYHKCMINRLVRKVGKKQPFFFSQEAPIFAIHEDAMSEIISYLPASSLFLQFGLTCRAFFLMASTKGVLHLSTKEIIQIHKAPSYVKKLKVISINVDREFLHTKMDVKCPAKAVIDLMNDKGWNFEYLQTLNLHCEYRRWYRNYFPIENYELCVSKLYRLEKLIWNTPHNLQNLSDLKQLKYLEIHLRHTNQLHNLSEVIPQIQLEKLRILISTRTNFWNIDENLSTVAKQLGESISKSKSLKKIDIIFSGRWMDYWKQYSDLLEKCTVPYDLEVSTITSDLMKILKKNHNVRKLTADSLCSDLLKDDLSSIREIELRDQIVFDCEIFRHFEAIEVEIFKANVDNLADFLEIPEKSLKRLIISKCTGKFILFSLMERLEKATVSEVIIKQITNLRSDKTGVKYMKSLKKMIQTCNHLKVFKVNIPRPDGCSIDALLNELNYNTNLEIFEPWILSDEEVNLIKLNKGSKKRKRSERNKKRKKMHII